VSAPTVPGTSFQAEPSGGGADHLLLLVTASKSGRRTAPPQRPHQETIGHPHGHVLF